MIFGTIWRRITRTRYTRELELRLAHERTEIERQDAEILRLRAENRALLNSILGIAGIPPITMEPPRRSTAETGRAIAPFARNTSGAVRPSSREIAEKARAAALESQTVPVVRHSESARADAEPLFGSPPVNSAGENSPPGASPRNDAPLLADDAAVRKAAQELDLALELAAETATSRTRQIASPLRRRSWHQVNRMLELASRKKDER